MKKLLGRLLSPFGKPPAELAPDPAPATRPAPAPFEPQNALEQMLVLASGDPSSRAEFQKMLLAEDLFAATPDTPDDTGWRTVEADETVSLLNVTGPDGAPVAAIFTSEARVAEVLGPGAGFIRMNGETLLTLVAEGGAFLNPGLGYGVHWTAPDLAAVLGRPVTRTLTQDTKVLLGSPSQPPEDLIADLRATLGADPRISEAWLALAHWPDGGNSSWYLDVRTSLQATDMHAVLADVFKRGNFNGLPLDLIVNGPGGNDGVGIRIAPLQTH